VATAMTAAFMLIFFIFFLFIDNYLLRIDGKVSGFPANCQIFPIMKEHFSRDDEMTAIEAIDLFSRQYKH
jgi:hypothetical protein